MSTTSTPKHNTDPRFWHTLPRAVREALEAERRATQSKGHKAKAPKPSAAERRADYCRAWGAKLSNLAACIHAAADAAVETAFWDAQAKREAEAEARERQRADEWHRASHARQAPQAPSGKAGKAIRAGLLAVSAERIGSHAEAATAGRTCGRLGRLGGLDMATLLSHLPGAGPVARGGVEEGYASN